jgi:hypothetical protein
MDETLVIVHLSSLDSLQRFSGTEAVQVFSQTLIDATQEHSGFVLIMDQGTPEHEMFSEACMWRNRVLSCRGDIIYFHHDEMVDRSPWQDGMKALAKVLRGLRTKYIRLGGLWASQSGKSGCVHEVKRQMRARNITCRLDKRLCAFE